MPIMEELYVSYRIVFCKWMWWINNVWVCLTTEELNRWNERRWNNVCHSISNHNEPGHVCPTFPMQPMCLCRRILFLSLKQDLIDWSTFVPMTVSIDTPYLYVFACALFMIHIYCYNNSNSNIKKIDNCNMSLGTIGSSHNQPILECNVGDTTQSYQLQVYCSIVLYIIIIIVDWCFLFLFFLTKFLVG